MLPFNHTARLQWHLNTILFPYITPGLEVRPVTLTCIDRCMGNESNAETEYRPMDRDHFGVYIHFVGYSIIHS